MAISHQAANLVITRYGSRIIRIANIGSFILAGQAADIITGAVDHSHIVGTGDRADLIVPDQSANIISSTHCPHVVGIGD